MSMSFNKTLSIRRKEKDVFKLKSADYNVVAMEQASTYTVEFKGSLAVTQARPTPHTRRGSG
jgi:hypothetical protein